MISRQKTSELVREYIKNDALVHHCKMVATAMEHYAKSLNKTELEIEDWWTAGMLHDLDWEKYPDEHPNKAVNEILPLFGYSDAVIEAIKAHAPGRTGKEPTTEIERYLFACDEISGFMHAVSLMRPTGFKGMKPKSVNKKLKTLNFAASVSRDDIYKGATLINKELNTHMLFLISVFDQPID